MNEALNRLPPAEVDARNQRLRRAHDISLKKEYLPKEQQALQTPYLNYMKVLTLLIGDSRPSPDDRGLTSNVLQLLNAELAPASLKMLLDTLMSLRAGRDLVHDLGAWPQDALEQVQAENRERILLGTGKPCVPPHTPHFMQHCMPQLCWVPWTSRWSTCCTGAGMSGQSLEAARSGPEPIATRSGQVKRIKLLQLH